MNSIGWGLAALFLATFALSLIWIGVGAWREQRKADARRDLAEPIYLFHRSERPSA